MTTAVDETHLLLDLLREAGDEAVTLDELQIVGVRDPAAALLALELAGHSVHRVYEQPSVTCIRLGAPAPVLVEVPDVELPTIAKPAPVPVSAPPAPVAARDARPWLLVLAGALLVLVLARRGR